MEQSEVVSTDKNWRPMAWIWKNGKEKASGFGYTISPATVKDKEVVAFALTLPPKARLIGANPEFSNPGPQRRNTDKMVVRFQYPGAKEELMMVIPLNSGDKRIDPNNFRVHEYSERAKYEDAQKFQPELI